MEVLKHYNQTRFMGFVPQIRKETGEWWIVEITLSGKTTHNAPYIALKLREHFADKEGIIFICGSKDILILAHLGLGVTSDSIRGGLTEKLPKHSCTTQAADLTADGLTKIQLRLESILDDKEKQQALLQERKERKEKIIMVVDDDALIRTLIKKTFLNKKCRIIEYKDTRNVLEDYLEQLPDMVLLDIHLPDGSGINLLQEINQFDETAYVIILSGDTAAENVMDAKKFGAKGFVAKPFTIEKLETCYKKCPSLT